MATNKCKMATASFEKMAVNTNACSTYRRNSTKCNTVGKLLHAYTNEIKIKLYKYFVKATNIDFNEVDSRNSCSVSILLVSL